MARKSIATACAALALALFSAGHAAAQGTTQPWKLVSWSSSLGGQSVTYEILYGLKAAMAFMNANGGVRGRELSLYALEMDDENQDFRKSLDILMIQTKPDLVVGGASSWRAGSTAEYLQRVARPWFGPWTEDPDVYANREDDPAGLLPTATVQLRMLFARAKAKMQPGKSLYFVFRDGPRVPRLSEEAHLAAMDAGIDLKPVRLSLYFRDWGSLRESFPGAGAVVLWLAPGPSAAIRRIIGPLLGPDTIWMTHSLNPPGHELMSLTGGLWSGTLFPAILTASSEIPEAYSTVLNKYALPGLRLGYQSYLGFTQGQLLFKAIDQAGARRQATPGGILRALKDTPSSGTLFAGKKLPSGPADPAGVYLAEADPLGGWRRAAP
ncbi:MAG: ABC transporter substrate-binding protein [Deltaproteobacteria bacterium]|jgi:hypothetical protein|nr:ABC transporter substrate-binding protein [Deltaproteobacteria bacterium]